MHALGGWLLFIGLLALALGVLLARICRSDQFRARQQASALGRWLMPDARRASAVVPLPLAVDPLPLAGM